jgi:hypothetical protein
VERVDLISLRRRLNKFMARMWQIAWWGTFHDLCEGRQTYAVAVRKEFFEDQADDGEEVSSCRVIDKTLRRQFIEYLQEYGH